MGNATHFLWNLTTCNETNPYYLHPKVNYHLNLNLYFYSKQNYVVKYIHSIPPTN